MKYLCNQLFSCSKQALYLFNTQCEFPTRRSTLYYIFLMGSLPMFRGVQHIFYHSLFVYLIKKNNSNSCIMKNI